MITAIQLLYVLPFGMLNIQDSMLVILHDNYHRTCMAGYLWQLIYSLCLVSSYVCLKIFISYLIFDISASKINERSKIVKQYVFPNMC